MHVVVERFSEWTCRAESYRSTTSIVCVKNVSPFAIKRVLEPPTIHDIVTSRIGRTGYIVHAREGSGSRVDRPRHYRGHRSHRGHSYGTCGPQIAAATAVRTARGDGSRMVHAVMAPAVHMASAQHAQRRARARCRRRRRSAARCRRRARCCSCGCRAFCRAPAAAAAVAAAAAAGCCCRLGASATARRRSIHKSPNSSEMMSDDSDKLGRAGNRRKNLRTSKKGASKGGGGGS